VNDVKWRQLWRGSNKVENYVNYPHIFQFINLKEVNNINWN